MLPALPGARCIEFIKERTFHIVTLLNETLEVKLNKDISVPAQVNLLSSEVQTNEIICKSITNS